MMLVFNYSKGRRKICNRVSEVGRKGGIPWVPLASYPGFPQTQFDELCVREKPGYEARVPTYVYKNRACMYTTPPLLMQALLHVYIYSVHIHEHDIAVRLPQLY